MFIVNTKFQYKEEHKVRWLLPGKRTKEGDWSFTYTYMYIGANADADHPLVIVKLNINPTNEEIKEQTREL